MQSTFHAADAAQAVIQNATAIGSETLVVTLHPEHDLPIELEIREATGSDDLVSSSMSINQEGLQQLVRWLRQQGIVE